MTALATKSISVSILFLGVLLGALLGTHWIAKGLGYHSALGSPIFSYRSMHFYEPWKIFEWSNALNSVAPTLVRQGFQLLMGGACAGLLGLVGVTVLTTKKKEVENVFGDASWATLKDVAKRGLLKGKGIFLGALPDGRYLRYQSPEHIAIIAPTRTGKSAGIVIPTLLAHRSSALIYDLKEDIWKKTAATRGEFSDLIYLNFNSPESSHFNPLLEIRQGIYEVRDTQNVANMVIEPDQAGVRDHWYEAANSMLVATILHVLYVGSKEEKNLAGVTAFLSRAEQRVTETLQEMMETKHLKDERGTPNLPHPGVVAAARDVLNKSGDDASGVHSSIMAKLSKYRDPLLAHNTRDSDFTIDELVSGERPKSLYLIVPPADIERLRPITRLIINQICRRLTDPDLVKTDADLAKRHELLLMLDEFPALGHLDFFENALAFVAGYKMKAILVCQSMNQLKQAYGERTSILDNTGVRLFFTPSTVETAEYISRTLGTTTVNYRTHGESGKKGSPFFSAKSESSHISSRPLMTAREVMELPDNEAILFVGSSKPIRAQKIRYFEDANFIPLVRQPPIFTREGVKPKDSVWFSERFCPETVATEDIEETEKGTDRGASLDESLLVVTEELSTETEKQIKLLKHGKNSKNEEELI